MNLDKHKINIFILIKEFKSLFNYNRLIKKIRSWYYIKKSYILKLTKLVKYSLIFSIFNISIYILIKIKL